MASKVEIFNMALDFIEGPALVEIATEDTNEARVCRRHYESSRDSTLRGHPWNFATTYMTLADLGTPPNTKWDYMYAYPTDCARALEIVNYIATTRIEFEVAYHLTHGRVIYTDQEDADLRFTATITDTEMFDPNFTAALAALLGFRICGAVNGSKEKKGAALSTWRTMLSAAGAADAGEGMQENNIDAAWIEARV